jgi:hypothetical protein
VFLAQQKHFANVSIYKDSAMDNSEAVVKTVIHVVSESPNSIVVQYPADLSTGVTSVLVGLLVLVGGYVWLYKHRAQVSHGLLWLIWVLPLVVGSVPLIFGVLGAITTITVEASSETGMLTVRRIAAGSLINTVSYPLTDVRGVQMGFDRGCKYLYATLADGSDPKLLPCSPRTGYSEVAFALNSFLSNLREAAPSQ